MIVSREASASWFLANGVGAPSGSSYDGVNKVAAEGRGTLERIVYMVDDRHVWFGGNVLMVKFVGSLVKDELEVKTRRG